jgi:predicted ABC-type ATPase
MSPTHKTAPRIIIIAGPNGAGKSTFAREFLPKEADCPLFVNADLIAAGLSPFAPEKAAVRAGRIMLTEIRRHAASGENFAFETTLAGRGYARLIPTWSAAGYSVHLYFLKLPDVAIAIARVAARVVQGGHDVPREDILRRFEKGWSNFERVYCPLVDRWTLYDNAGGAPRVLEEGGKP